MTEFPGQTKKGRNSVKLSPLPVRIRRTQIWAAETLQVKRSGDFYYPIYFEEGFDTLADAIRTEGLDSRKMCIVTDTNVAPLVRRATESCPFFCCLVKFSVFVFEAGEKSKNLNTVQQLYKELIEN